MTLILISLIHVFTVFPVFQRVTCFGQQHLCSNRELQSLPLRHGRQVRRCLVVPQSAIVALTREDGKNDKLAELLEAKGLTTVDLPCIAHGVGAHRHLLPGALAKVLFRRHIRLIPCLRR